VNFSTPEYFKKQLINTFTGKFIAGIDNVYSYSLSEMDMDFYRENRAILAHSKGAGLWLWKPYFFNKVLTEKVEFGDYLIHCDSASFFIRKIKPLILIMKEYNLDVMCFSLPFPEYEWTSPFVLDFFNLPASSREDNQILASYFIVRKTIFTIKFIDEWLKLCCDYNLITGGLANEQIESLGFKEHRFDQSIFSLLCKRYNISTFRDPSQYGRFPEAYRRNGSIIALNNSISNYKTTIILVRRKSCFSELLRFIIKSFLSFFFSSIYKRAIE
jgi:hypothetical protein